MLNQALTQYATTKNTELRNHIIELALPLVYKVAKQCRHLYHPQLTYDEAISETMYCLVDCVEKYDQKKGISFEAYTYTRLRNHIIDTLRAQDFIPRRVRQEHKKVAHAYETLSNTFMREPSDQEMAKHLDMSLEELTLHYHEFHMGNVASMDEHFELYGENLSDHGQDPHLLFLKQENRHLLIQALKQLDEREQLLLQLYYYENLKMKEIGFVLELSEARVCQIHSKALTKLKKIMEGTDE